MPTLQEIALRTAGVDARIVSGHRMCAGCGIGAVVKNVLAASDKPVIVLNATGCLEVTSSVYPFTAWNTPWMHLTFENAAAVAAGVESAYRSLKHRGKITAAMVALMT
jgi:pyruvate ferredoxin oxidoreductase beta subunit